MKTHRLTWKPVLLVAAMWLSHDYAQASDGVVNADMVGRWEGNAQVIVVWCQRTNLPVVLDIRADGTVSGRIGDATLAKARLKKNRGWLGRKLNVKTDYIIVSDLQGAIVAREGISRSYVKMPLNFRGGSFVGGIHTSGSKLGGKDRGILSARLTLRRMNNP